MLLEGGPETFAALVSLGFAGDVAALVMAVVGEVRARSRRSEHPGPPRLLFVASAVVLLGAAAVFFLAGLLSGAMCIGDGCVTSSDGSSLPLIGSISSTLGSVLLLLAFLASSRSGRTPERARR